MKVSGGARTGTVRAGGSQPQKNIGSLSKGDTFTAKVVGVSGGSVSLMFAGGGAFTAAAKNTSGIAEGMHLQFTVEANENGQVYVKMSAIGGDNVLKIARKALMDAGLLENARNLEAAKALIESGVTPDSGMMRQVASGMDIAGMTPEKLLFFINESIDINEGALKLLDDNILNRNGLASELNGLIEKIACLPVNVRNDAVSVILGKATLTGEFTKLLKKALFIDVAGERGEQPGGYYKRLYNAVGALMRLLPEFEETKAVLDAAKSIKTALEFQNEISEYKSYMQIPFVFEGKAGQGDLYVFKEPKNGAKQEKRSTALLCLDFAGFGRVEAFISLAGKSVSCSFGLSERFIGPFREHSFELHRLLAQKGYTLADVAFERLDGAFNLLKEPPGTPEKPVQRQVYSFDAKA